MYAKNDDRRTEIVHAEGELDLEDLIAEEDMVIAITRSGYIKRLPVTAYREQKRGGKGVMGMDLKEVTTTSSTCSSPPHTTSCSSSRRSGRSYRLKVHELPLGSRQSNGPRGRQPASLPPGRADPRVVQTRNFEEAEFLVFATKRGMVKKTKLAEYNTTLKADGIIAINLKEDDELVGVRHRRQRRRHPDGLPQRSGDSLQREGCAADGPRDRRCPGHAARKDDEVIEVNIARDDDDLLVVTDQGYGSARWCASTRARAVEGSG